MVTRRFRIYLTLLVLVSRTRMSSATAASSGHKVTTLKVKLNYYFEQYWNCIQLVYMLFFNYILTKKI